jgi:hypothetical protein
MTEGLARILPASFAVTFMLMLLFNLWLAGRVLRASGQLARPWPDIAGELEYPRGTPLALLVATGIGFIDGLAGMAAGALSGALFLAYLLLGLAIIHHLTRGQGWRPILLGALYLGLLISPIPAPFNPVPLIVALLGLADTIRPLRRKPPT